MNCTFADELKGGALDDDLPILVLPDALTLGTAEIEALRRYVEKGGVLLADLRAGLYTEDGKSAFDRKDLVPLFGFTRVKPQIDMNSREIRLKAHPDLSIKVCGKGWINAEGADVLAAFADGTSAILEKRIGKGRVLFFNCVLQESAESGIVKASPSGKGVETSLHRGLIDFIAKRLREHVRPEVELAEPGKEPTGVRMGQETVCFDAGAARFVYTRDVFDMRPDVPVSVVLPKPAHVYEMGRGRYLGFVSRMEAPSDRWVKMLALLPAKVEGLEAIPQKEYMFPGETAVLEAVLKARRCGNHVFRLKVMAPDDRLMTEYPPRLMAMKGKASICLPLALNAVPGRYAVEIEDVVTGAAAKTAFWVR